MVEHVPSDAVTETKVCMQDNALVEDERCVQNRAMPMMTEQPAHRGERRRSSNVLGTAVPGLEIAPPRVESVFYAMLDQDSNTLGMNVIFAATRPATSGGKMCLLLTALLSVVFLQLTLMATFFLATSLQPCSTHKDCRSGEYCCKCNGFCKVSRRASNASSDEPAR